MARLAVAVSGGADSLYALLSLQEAGHEVLAMHGLFLPKSHAWQQDQSKIPLEAKLCSKVKNAGQAKLPCTTNLSMAVKASDTSRQSFAPQYMAPDLACAVVQGLQNVCCEHAIPLYIFDFRKEFDTQVITPFIQAYAMGDTPNPCALCNAHIKFGLLMQTALAPQEKGGLGADFFATGHYAKLAPVLSTPPVAHSIQQGIQQSVQYPQNTSCLTPEKSPLCKGQDLSKDQSYFLSLVPRKCFEKVLFPLAHTTKVENVKYLQQRNVVIPVPKESQEICFVPADAYRDFLWQEAQKRHISLGKGGPIYVLENAEEIPLDAKFGDKTLEKATTPSLSVACPSSDALPSTKAKGKGRKKKDMAKNICQHAGLWQYTEGQRRGLGVAWKEPLYVFSKDMARNALILSNKQQCVLKACRVEHVNYFVAPELWPQDIFVKVRHRQREAAAQVQIVHDAVLDVVFLQEQSPTAPGQIAAFYDAQGQVLCGGIITEVRTAV